MNESEIIVVLGPTASGKSDFAVNLALELNGEIISADSRQVYKDLDIGTGKITEAEMKGVKHYMLSVYDLDDEISVARYARDARPILEDILKRGKTPIVCGGTGQYIDALIFDTEIPAIEPDHKLREQLEKLPTEELVARLTVRDPARATAIDPHNRVRLIRALEIVESLGKVPELVAPKLIHKTKIYLMNPTRELIRERITKRLLTRLSGGMLEECKQLLEKGVTHERLEKLGLEYRYMSRYVSGNLTYEVFLEELGNKINQYAKRQQTWNKKYTRNYPEITELVKVEK